MPTAAGSPIAGISFDDRPLMLPVQRNFQMAMLTASSELGRSCGRMEAYGWRLSGEEQDRVNQIFNNTVDRMRAQGYSVEAKAPTSISRDVTLFTADRADRHLIFLWSAGEIGLVMVLCETSAPLSPIAHSSSPESDRALPANLPANRMPMGKTSRTANRTQEDKPVQLSVAGKPLHSSFSPVGDWTGTYTCTQGTTGATLHVTHIKGDQFDGKFSFYPTAKNPYVPKGSYAVFGEYDSDSQRILVNPGKWIDRPKDFYNTIMIGSFDPVSGTFSGYFQGITGCTSFEATRDAASMPTSSKELKTPVIKKKVKASVPKKAKVKKTTEAAKAGKPVVPTPMLDETVTPVPSAPPVKGDLSIIKAPAKVAPAPRSSSIEPPAGILVGAPTDKK